MRRFAAAALAMTMLAIPAYASEITSDEYADGYYRVSGAADFGNQPVKIEVFNNGVDTTAADGVTADNIDDVYLYVNQIYAGEDKGFAFNVPIGDKKGNFNVRISLMKGDTIDRVFCTYSDEDVERDINAFAKDNNKNAEKLMTLIGDYYPALAVDMADINKLDEAGTASFCAAVIAEISENTTRTEFGEIINSNLVFSLLSKSGDAKILTKYEKYTDLPVSNYYVDWKDLTDDKKSEISNAAVGSSSIADMNARIENAVILNALNDVIWSGMQDKLEYYKDNLSLDLSGVLALDGTGQKNVYNDFKDMLKNREIKEISEVDGAIKKLVNKHMPKEDGPVGGGGGRGGSSGGGGGGGGFTAPAAEEARTPEATVPFSDIAGVEWASVPIIKLYQKGIVNGKESGVFDPNGEVTREEFAAMLVRAAGLSSDNADSGFDDIAADRWSSAAIAAAKENGIVGGVGGNLFAPEDKILRQDMAVMAYRAAEKCGAGFDEGGALIFDDKDDVAEYAAAPIAALCGAKIITGADNRFMPNDNTTRAEAAVVLYRLLDFAGMTD